MSSNNNRNSFSLFYEKSLKKFSGVYVQTKQNSIKLLNTLNINIANKLLNDDNNSEVKQIKQISSDSSDNKENTCVDSRPVYFNPLTPYQVENYHNFISDIPAPYYNHSTDCYDDDDVSNTYSPYSPSSSINSPLYKNTSFSHFSFYNPLYNSTTKHPYSQKSSYSINEKDLSDQDSSDDQDDYFSRKKNGSSSSSVSSTNYGVSDLVLTPMSNDDDYEIINENEVFDFNGKEKVKEKNLKRKKSTIRSITSQKSDRSIKSNKSIGKLSLKLSKSKSSSSIDTVGTINFEEFISSLDISEDVEGRLQWLFRFYDNDDDGFITRDEMLQIMHALYS